MIFYQVSRKLMISAGEASGELYGALLCREVKRLWPDTEIFGIGGPRMKSEGVTLIAPISHVAGIVEALKHLREIKSTLKKASDVLVKNRPDVLVVIDYPDFNITLARKAKAAGIPVFYYVSPQVWAWRSGRIKTIAAVADRMAVLFPFEEDIYKNSGLPCEFVGHPVAETMTITGTKEEWKNKLGLDPGKKLISLLPGSRPGEIKKHQPLVSEVAERFHREYPDIQIAVPLLSGTMLPEKFPDYVRVMYDKTRETLACSDAAAVASGTVTLETALLGIPMVVFYRTSSLTYYLLRMMVKVKHVSLVNLLSGETVVRELIQKEANAGNIFSELVKLLNNTVYRNDMIVHLNKISKLFEGRKPSERVARMAGELAGWDNAAAL